MKCAMESLGGIPGLSVTLCGVQDSPDIAEKWEGISFINNIAYSKEGITYWRAYKVGAGKSSPWSDFSLPNSTELPKLNKIHQGDEAIKATVVPIKPRRMPKRSLKTGTLQVAKKDDDDDDNGVELQDDETEAVQAVEKDDDDDDNGVELQDDKTKAVQGVDKADDDDNYDDGCNDKEEDGEDENENEDHDVGAQFGELDKKTLFFCPEEGCVKSFQRYSSLEKHIDYGSHKYVLEHETLYDKAMILYATKLEHGATEVPQIHEDTSVDLQHEVLPKGWALKSSAKRKRFNEVQKKYLIDIFENGESTGRKANPSAVAQAMRRAKNKDGSSMFNKNDYLTSQQIAGFFSRYARKKRSGLATSEEDKDETRNDENKETEIFDLMKEVIDVVAIQHPIMFENYNICDISSKSKLSSFSIKMLQEICSALELDISEITSRRKKPYVQLLEDLVRTCTCSETTH